MVMPEEEDNDASRKDWDIAFIGAKDTKRGKPHGNTPKRENGQR